MNIEYIKYCIRSVKRRWKSILRTSLAIFFAFVFVAGVMLFKSNMYQWQLQSVRHRFGSWIIMLYDSNLEENSELKNHPYLNESGKAAVDNYMYDTKKQQDVSSVKLGYMSDEFISIGNISLREGSMPQEDDEAAIEWDTLIKLNQGTTIGQDIVINIRKSNSPYSDVIEKTYKLTGILNNYTNVWTGGNNVPGIILKEDEADSINRIGKATYIYSSNNYIDKNYTGIYEGLKKRTKKSLIYNSSVYDYEPWGGGYIYDYMYIILMITGVAAVVYQMLIHSKERSRINQIMANLGASKLQIMTQAFIENVLIVIVAALSGMFLSIGLGKLVCYLIGRSKGYQFFVVESSIYTYVFVMFLVSVAASMVVSFIDKKNIKVHKQSKIGASTEKRISKKDRINKHNYIRQTYKRFIKTEGIVSGAAVRIFAFVMFLVIMGCIFNSVKAYKEYVDNSQKSDIIVFNSTDNESFYNMYYVKKKPMNSSGRLYDTDINNNTEQVRTREQLKENISKMKFVYDYTFEQYNNMYSYYSVEETEHGTQKYLNEYSSFRMSNNIKKADTILFNGFDDNTIDYIMNIDGVEDISYGYYETGRTWHWNTMDYNKLGTSWYINYSFNDNSIQTSSDGNTCEEKYLFATEYVEDGSDMYDILKSHIIKGDFDDEAFNSGEEVVIFVDKNPDGEYDDTIVEGIDIKLNNYKCRLTAYNNTSNIDSLNSYERALSTYIKNSGLDDKITYVDSLTNKPDYEEEKQNYRNYLINEIYSPMTLLWLDNKSEDEQYEEVMRYFFNKIKKNYYYYIDYEPAATTKAAYVIQLDDDMKEMLKEYVPEFGQYTMIASLNLANKAMDTQNEIIKNYFQLDELPDEIKLKPVYNQIKLRYSMNSLYSGTVNTVNSYMQQAGIGYNSYSEEKDEVKSKTLEAIIFYTFTGVMAACVYIIIAVLVLNSRILRHKETMQILLNSGADRSIIFHIYMKWCVRESVYCIILMPVILIVDAMIIRKAA